MVWPTTTYNYSCYVPSQTPADRKIHIKWEGETKALDTALDVVGVAASSDFSAYLDDLEDFTEILEDEAGYYTLFCSGAPETTWWQEEVSGGEDNDYADNTQLSLILAHSDVVSGHVQIDFGPSQPSTGPNPVRLGYERKSQVGWVKPTT